ncbi:MAG: hypothetical protein JXB26_18640 [Candidatus Aminicenantes bacterium]|nr:hypothetical protein [Candidatus Aminicenantes bacterium]
MCKEVEKNIRNKMTCLFVCPPHDLLVCAKKLKMKYPNIRMLIDWQDLLSFDEYYFSKHPNWKKERMIRLERDVLKFINMNIFSNYKAENMMISQFDISSYTCTSIVHPFDKEELPSKEVKYFNKKLPGKGIKYGFLGGLFKEPKVPGDKFLLALKHVVTNIDTEATLHIWGTSYRIIEKTCPSSRNMHKNIFAYDFIPHEKALSELSHCDVLILILGHVPNANVIMHAKLSHYLALGLPILAFVPENSFVREVINRTKKGFVVSDNDWIKGFIDFYNNIENISFEANKKEIDKFGLDRFISNWMEILD